MLHSKQKDGRGDTCESGARELLSNSGIPATAQSCAPLVVILALSTHTRIKKQNLRPPLIPAISTNPRVTLVIWSTTSTENALNNFVL